MSNASAPNLTEPKPAQPFYLQLWFLVLVAMVLGIALGHFRPDAGVRMEPLGDAFIKAIRALIAPIIFCTVVHGIASMADMAKVGRVALKALIYFEVLTTLALVLGLVAVNVFAPGVGMNVDLSHVDTASDAPYIGQTHSRTTTEFLLGIIPNTFIGAFAEGNVLQVLFVSVLCGFALSAMGQAGKPLTDLIGTAAQMFFRIVAIVMWAAPIGAFGAIAFTVRCRFAAVLGQAPDQLLCHLPDLHSRRALAGRAFYRHQPVQFHPLYPRRAVDRDRDHVVGNRAAAHDGKARSGRLRRERGRTCDPDRLFVQPRRHLSLSGDGGGVFGAGDQHAVAAHASARTARGAAARLQGRGGRGRRRIHRVGRDFGRRRYDPESVAIILGVHRLMSQALTPTNLIGNGIATLVIARWELALDETQLQAALNGGGAKSKV